MKKIAVNIVTEINMAEAYNDVINFLFTDKEEYERELAAGKIRIDFFVCHADVKEVYNGPAYKNSKVISSILVNEEKMFQTVNNGLNSQTLLKNKKLFKQIYRSYINSIQMHKNTTKSFYDMVISYDHSLKNFTHKKKTDFTIENDFLYTHIIEPRWLKIDYKLFVCSPATFFKIVNMWHFLKIVADSTFKIWQFIETAQDADKFVLPMWLNMQSIKVRRIDRDL